MRGELRPHAYQLPRNLLCPTNMLVRRPRYSVLLHAEFKGTTPPPPPINHTPAAPRVLFLGICLDRYYFLWRGLLPKIGFHLNRGSVSQAFGAGRLDKQAQGLEGNFVTTIRAVAQQLGVTVVLCRAFE